LIDAWHDLDPTAPDWLTLIIKRLLAVDVPPTALAKAFDLDVEPIRELLIDMRVERYGTAELAEAMHGLMWKAYADTVSLMEKAAPSRRLQLNLALLSKASALVGGGTPDSVAKMQAEFSQLAQETRGSGMDIGIYEPSAPDAPIDDPEERPIG
jgi:hypothetical protein